MFGGVIGFFGEDDMDRVLSHGPAPTSVTEAPEQDAMTLEAVELEFALGAIDVLTEGFDAALAKAAERVGGEVLFNMPPSTPARRSASALLPFPASHRIR